MDIYYRDLEELVRGAIVEVTLLGNAANVRLLDPPNFNAYVELRPYKYEAGGHVTQSPIHLKVPRDGHWYVTVDYGPHGGSGQRYARVYLPDLPQYRERGLQHRRRWIRESRGGWMTRRLNEKKQQRLLFMRGLYEMTGGEDAKGVGTDTLRRELGWSLEVTDSVASYLKAEGLLTLASKGAERRVALTHAGVVEVEKAINDPSSPTEHFPPLRWIVERRATERLRNSPWGSGSFYLVAFISLTAVLFIVGEFLSVWLVPLVATVVLLSITLVGVLQLRHDEALSEEGFVSLVGLVLRKLPALVLRQPEPARPGLKEREIDTEEQLIERELGPLKLTDEVHHEESMSPVQEDSASGGGEGATS